MKKLILTIALAFTMALPVAGVSFADDIRCVKWDTQIVNSNGKEMSFYSDSKRYETEVWLVILPFWIFNH